MIIAQDKYISGVIIIGEGKLVKLQIKPFSLQSANEQMIIVYYEESF